MLCCATLTVYFAHHAMYGRYGIERNRSLSADATALAGKLDILRSERSNLERDIGLLSGAPHPDMVEEAARRVLGFAYPQANIVNLKR